MRYIDITGQRFGRLTAVERVTDEKTNGVVFLCRCDCGNMTHQRSSNLRYGRVVSCGCYNQEIRGKATITHGMSHTKEYDKWLSAIARCHDKNQTGYDRYGGRGVSVCEEWRGEGGFERFYEHIGPIPMDGQKWTLERIDPNKNYEPNNVKWLPAHLQPRNKKKMCTNTTGVTGVVREVNEGHTRFRAFWCDLITGKNKSKSFAASRYGYDQAFQLACEYRVKMIAELNAQGAGYTETHGL